jgi:hypothetical protein
VNDWIGCLAEVDQADVLAIEGFVVPGVGAQAFAADHLARGQPVGDGGVGDQAPHLLPHELGRAVVDVRVEHEIDERAHEEQAAALPVFLVADRALLGVGGGTEIVGGRIVGTKAKMLLTTRLAEGTVAPLHVALVVRRQGPVVSRYGIGGRALEHGQVRGLARDDRDRLHARRARADEADALAAKVHPVVRPAAGVVDRTPKGVSARDRGHAGAREVARRHDAGGCGDAFALGLDVPRIADVVEVRAPYARVESHVAEQIEALRNVLDVPQDLGLRGVALGPLPLLLELL